MKIRTLSLLVALAACTLPSPAAAAFQGTLNGARAGLSAEEREILSHLSIVYLDNGFGGTVKTIRVSGVNLQLVNGLEATNGHPADPTAIDPGLTTTNGVGNLIVGYNEVATPSATTAAVRTTSSSGAPTASRASAPSSGRPRTPVPRPSPR